MAQAPRSTRRKAAPAAAADTTDDPKADDVTDVSQDTSTDDGGPEEAASTDLVPTPDQGAETAADQGGDAAPEAPPEPAPDPDTGEFEPSFWLKNAAVFLRTERDVVMGAFVGLEHGEKLTKDAAQERVKEYLERAVAIEHPGNNDEE